MGKPNIIYEDNDIIVCYKPAGMATQTRRIGQQDMESFIRNYRAAKNEPPYVGIVHRLDQPVEGVMVFAKNQNAAASLSRQIKEHTTEKYYYAASYGNGSGSNTSLKVHTLTDYILFDKRTNTSKITTAKDPQAKKAVLEYEIVKAKHSDNEKADLKSANERINGNGEKTHITIFNIKLLTGRHHQIRLQFANIGYPLIGDTKYGGEGTANNGIVGNEAGNIAETAATSGSVKTGRGRGKTREQLALCSYKIVIDHPVSGKRMTFEVKPANPVFQKL